MSYQLKHHGVTRLADGAHIPNDTGNRDWRDYLAWVADGNEPAPEFTLAETKVTAAGRITQARNGALQALTAVFDGDTWDANEDTGSRIANALTMIQQAASLGIQTPASIPWRTADNKDRVLTIAQLISMGAAVFMAQQQVWGKQAALKNKIASEASADGVEKIAW